MTCRNMCQVNRKLRRWEDAAACLRQAVETYRRLLPANDPRLQNAEKELEAQERGAFR